MLTSFKNHENMKNLYVSDLDGTLLNSDMNKNIDKLILSLQDKSPYDDIGNGNTVSDFLSWLNDFKYDSKPVGFIAKTVRIGPGYEE